MGREKKRKREKNDLKREIERGGKEGGFDLVWDEDMRSGEYQKIRKG